MSGAGRAASCCTSTVVFNLETWDGREGLNAVQWSDYTIEGPDGTWAGHIYGLYDD